MYVLIKSDVLLFAVLSSRQLHRKFELGGVSLQVPLPSVLAGLKSYLWAHHLELPPGKLVTMHRVEIRGRVLHSPI